MYHLDCSHIKWFNISDYRKIKQVSPTHEVAQTLVMQCISDKKKYNKKKKIRISV